MPNKLDYERRLREGRCTRCGNELVGDRKGYSKCLTCQEAENERRRNVSALNALTTPPRQVDASMSRSMKRFLDPEETRAALVDIESTGLFGDFDLPLCVVIKTYGKKETHVVPINMERRSLLAAEK